MKFTVELIEIFSCLCEATRLRIINLLTAGPLCVCHFQEILGEPQVKISKHLNYLKQHGLVQAQREANWMIYSLPAKPSRELKAQLACLQDCRGEEPILRKDSQKLAQLKKKFEASSPICCESDAGLRKTRKTRRVKSNA